MAIAPARVAAILLAAGQSRRFGHADKLLHAYRGEPLALHAARTLANLGFHGCLAVTSDKVAAILPAAFRCVANPSTERGISSSITVGAAAIAEWPVDACLIALADMPLVPAEHFRHLLDAFAADDPRAIVATQGGKGRAMVPALFGRDRFAELTALSGDHGARDLLITARTIACDPACLVDFDREADFGN